MKLCVDHCILGVQVGAESSESQAIKLPIRSNEKRCPQPFELQMRCSLYVRDVKLRGAARNPRANPHEHSISLGQGWSSGGCSALVSCAPNRKSGPLIPSLSFPHDCNDLLPAQVARSARRRSTSRLHERARHVWRRGTVHSSLGFLLEGHFLSQSFISRLKDFDRCDALT